MRRIGVEEEFHLVDLETRRLSPRAPEVLDSLAGSNYVAELQRCVVEVNTDVVDDLSALRDQLLGWRSRLVEVAEGMGLGIVAAGMVPLAVPSELTVTPTERYRQMLADYQLLAREQLICGSQVHIDVADRDEGVRLAHRVAPFLPILLALSASSPYRADGSDTGYASARTLLWQGWPTTGLTPQVGSAAEYDQLVDDLVATGIITDPGMMYFDTRPTNLPTLELRICDACPSVDTVVLVAGLFRALVDREVAAVRSGARPPDFPATVGRAAVWRAARSGLEGELVDVLGRTHRPAAEIVRGLADSLRPQLEDNGDWEQVDALVEEAVAAGSSAARQRRAMRRRGLLTDVVDLLVAETASTVPTALPTPGAGHLFSAYAGDTVETIPVFDEAVDAGEPRPHYRRLLATSSELGAARLRRRESRMEDLQRADGVMFRSGGGQRIFPLDLVPRIITAEDWRTISTGGAQRARALDAFLADVYGERQIVHDEVIPPGLLDRVPGHRSTGRLARGVRAHICGLDVVASGAGRWQVLEDNLRVPSGTAYSLWNRQLIQRFMPELQPPAPLADHDQVATTLLETLVAAAPPACPETPRVALLTSGTEDSAYAEHRQLAHLMGVPIVQPEHLRIDDGHLVAGPGGKLHIDVLYARMDEDMLLSSAGADGQPLREGLLAAVENGTVTIANALGNGVADDKAVYAHVPAMIRYYLGEDPILDNVETFQCADREQRDHVLDNLERLVTKPVDGFGGFGVVIGPAASDEELAQRRVELLGQPERFIAQEVVNLSTVPTFDGNGFTPNHVDLRVFVHLRAGAQGTEAVVPPAALTRVAASGSMIVNSSAGGGSKDTWILTEPAQSLERAESLESASTAGSAEPGEDRQGQHASGGGR